MLEDGTLQSAVTKIEFDQTTDVHSIIFDGFTADSDDLVDGLNESTENYKVKWNIKPHDNSIEILEVDPDIASDSYDEMKNQFENSPLVS